MYNLIKGDFKVQIIVKAKEECNEIYNTKGVLHEFSLLPFLRIRGMPNYSR